MSNTAFIETVNGEKVATSHTEKKKVGDRVVWYGNFYKIIALHGIGRTFTITLQLENSTTKITVSGNAINYIRVVVSPVKKIFLLERLKAYMKRRQS